MYSKLAAQKIKKMFLADQEDRANKKWQKLPPQERWKIIGARDKKRINSLRELLKKHQELNGEDYFRAGIIFQHGNLLKDIRTAKKLAYRGHVLGSKDASWLYAAATDRECIMQKKKQKFGTQYGMKNGKWILFPILRSTTDAMRAKFNIEPLREIKKINPATPRKKKRGFGVTSFR